MRRIHVIDSHTGGEPTRVVVSGGPPLRRGSVAMQRDQFRREFDRWRTAIVCEPRGSDVLVGALVCEPAEPNCAAGVIFFNNVGYLGMCGHGLIGVAATLAHLGRIGPGRHRIETPVGVIPFELEPGGRVSFENVPSFRHAKDVAIDVPGEGRVIGDVAWGGNWFFLTGDQGRPLDLRHVGELAELTRRVRAALERDGITGADGGLIDHIELFGPPGDPANDARNFVLCPGLSYDRSPCGTGTSAKLACLYADGKLAEGRTWRQESILGSVFEGSVRIAGPDIIPRIRGSAFVCAEATLLLDPNDPFEMGIGHGP
jgi:4-hydroxyproline epimerase